MGQVAGITRLTVRWLINYVVKPNGGSLHYMLLTSPRFSGNSLRWMWIWCTLMRILCFLLLAGWGEAPPLYLMIGNFRIAREVMNNITKRIPNTSLNSGHCSHEVVVLRQCSGLRHIKYPCFFLIAKARKC